MKRTKQRSRPRGRDGEPKKRGFSWKGFVALVLVGGGAYMAGGSMSPSFFGWIRPTAGDTVAHDVDFSEEDDKIAVAGSQPKKDEIEAKPVKSSTGSVFSEGEAPVIVGEVPEGWRVETSNDIKVKFGPHKVPVGDDITFVVPVYTLVPGDAPGGVYIIEPGRTKEGHDEGGTLASVLTRLDSETQAVERALGSLSEAIAMLPAPEKEAVVEVDQGEVKVSLETEGQDDQSDKKTVAAGSSVTKTETGKSTGRATR